MKKGIIWFLLFHFVISYSQKNNDMHYNPLTPEEAAVIIHKGTERPFSGKYINHKDKGTYICKQCNNPLYYSDFKFDSGCGWPSFDDEIPGAVTRQIDSDGNRTEILCSKCGAHLGHVFKGENFTKKNIRHCVNSISLNFIPDTQKTEKAMFAGGCFWGVEFFLKRLDGVTSVKVGYSGGNKPNPSYEEVCSGMTGHAETIEINFNPDKISYEQLVKYFFEIHDPTQLNRQGPDIGEQYRSEIFYFNQSQKEIAEKLILILKQKNINVVTRLSKAGPFYEAEKYHQDYYSKKGGFPYCHRYIKRF